MCRSAYYFTTFQAFRSRNACGAFRVLLPFRGERERRNAWVIA